jgi:hypothetical protein
MDQKLEMHLGHAGYKIITSCITSKACLDIDFTKMCQNIFPHIYKLQTRVHFNSNPNPEKSKNKSKERLKQQSTKKTKKQSKARKFGLKQQEVKQSKSFENEIRRQQSRRPKSFGGFEDEESQAPRDNIRPIKHMAKKIVKLRDDNFLL